MLKVGWMSLRYCLMLTRAGRKLVGTEQELSMAPGIPDSRRPLVVVADGIFEEVSHAADQSLP
jgi:hypothetical protein